MVAQVRLNAALVMAQVLFAKAAARAMSSTHPPLPSPRPAVYRPHLTEALSAVRAQPHMWKLCGMAGIEGMTCATLAYVPQRPQRGVRVSAPCGGVALRLKAVGLRRIAEVCPARSPVSSEALATTLARWFALHQRAYLLRRCVGLPPADVQATARLRAESHVDAVIESLLRNGQRVGARGETDVPTTAEHVQWAHDLCKVLVLTAVCIVARWVCASPRPHGCAGCVRGRAESTFQPFRVAQPTPCAASTQAGVVRRLPLEGLCRRRRVVNVVW